MTPNKIPRPIGYFFLIAILILFPFFCSNPPASDPNLLLPQPKRPSGGGQHMSSVLRGHKILSIYGSTHTFPAQDQLH